MRRDVFQALADPTRRAIILMLAVTAMTPNAIAEQFAISRQAVSKHIKVMTECELLTQEQKGREIYYHLQAEKMKEIEKELASVRSAQALSQVGDLAKTATTINGHTFIGSVISDGVSGDDLRKIATDLKSRSANSVVALVSVVEGKAVLVAAVSDGAKSAGVKAGALVKIGSAILGGGGGGKDDFAQGGGTNLDQISVALSAITDAISGK